MADSEDAPDWEAVARGHLARLADKKRRDISDEIHGVEVALNPRDDIDEGPGEAFGTATLRTAEHLSHLAQDLKEAGFLTEAEAKRYIHLYELLMTAATREGWGGTVGGWKRALRELEENPPASLEEE